MPVVFHGMRSAPKQKDGAYAFFPTSRRCLVAATFAARLTNVELLVIPRNPLLACSMNDQREDKPRRELRSLVSGSLAVARETPEQGRFLASIRDVQPGEAVMRSMPYAVAVSCGYKKNVCSHCMKVFTPSQRKKKRIAPCTKCNQAFFCSRACIEANASSPETRHYEAECRALKTMYSPKWQDVDMSIFRLLVKVLSRRKYETEKRIYGQEEDEVTFEHVDNLVGHYHKQNGGDERPLTKEEEVNSQFSDALLQNLSPDLLAGLDKDGLLALISKIECNQFGVWGKNDALYGRGLYLNCALFNHR